MAVLIVALVVWHRLQAAWRALTHPAVIVITAVGATDHEAEVLVLADGNRRVLAGLLDWMRREHDRLVRDIAS